MNAHYGRAGQWGTLKRLKVTALYFNDTAMIAAMADARRQDGVSQRELARRSGKLLTFALKIDELERQVDVPDFIAIADAIGTTAISLVRMIRGSLPGAIIL